MSKHLFLLATLLPSLLSAVKAKSICEIIEDVLPGMTELPGTSGYEEAQTEYHSETQMGLTPACRVSPKSAANVSTIIQEAVKNQSPFAVHSGGYFMSIGGSNIGDEGFTIDLAELNTVEIAADKKSVKVGSGNRWESVYNPLAEQGLHAVGGRDPGIGTGGYLLGGGVSFLSYNHGLGADNVIEYEIVLASGDIVTANSKENSDLFWALRLGSTNYGVVTSFTINVFPVGGFWSGNRVYNYSDADALLANYPSYVDASNHNDTAAFTQFVFTVAGGEKVCEALLAYRSEEEEPPLYQVLAGDVEPVQDNMELTDVIGALNNIRDTSKVRSAPMTISVTNTDDALKFHKDQFEWAVERFAELANVPGWTFVTAVQPFPTAYLEPESPIHSKGDVNFSVLLMSAIWSNAEDDELVEAALSDWLAYASQEAEERGVLHPFVYLNYSGQSQAADVYTTDVSPEDLAKMQDIRAKYDPEFALAKLWPGGVKLPAPTN